VFVTPVGSEDVVMESTPPATVIETVSANAPAEATTRAVPAAIAVAVDPDKPTTPGSSDVQKSVGCSDALVVAVAASSCVAPTAIEGDAEVIVTPVTRRFASGPRTIVMSGLTAAPRVSVIGPERPLNGEAAVEGGQAPGLGPHAVGDGAAEAEKLRGQWVQMDRVAVAGDVGVSAADVVGDAPHGGQLAGDGFRSA
jgi:hypothetical protein